MTKTMPGARLHAVATVYALWILGMFALFYFVHGKDENSLQLALICGAIPAACQVFLLGVDPRGLVAPVRMWLVLLVVILMSYLVGASDPRAARSDAADLLIPLAWIPIVFAINTVFVLAIATLVAGCPDRRLFPSIASIYCVLTAPFLVYIDITGERVWGRLSAGLQPNMWGLVGLTVCLAAFARKPGILTIGSFVVGAATILLSSSRESLLSVAAGVMVVVALYLQDMNRPRFVRLLAGACVTLIVVAVTLDPYILNAIHYVGSEVFLLDSPERGLGSGFTGRSELWAAAYDIWLKSPLLGIGFRQHEQFMPDGMPAHNAYLAMLADTGMIGLIVYLVLLIGSLVGAYGIQDRRTRRFALAIIVAYIVSGFFDRRTINGGNPFSLFFLMSCSVALVDHSLRKAGAAVRRSLVRHEEHLDDRAPSIGHEPMAPG